MRDQEIRAALDRHWIASDANDFELEHDIYLEDAVLEYPQSGERIRGRRNIQITRTNQPNKKRFTVRRVVGSDDLWITEYILTYDGKPSYSVSGVYNKTCPGRSFCSVGRAYSDVKTPVRGDFTQYHTYGFLWVPATGSSTGYGQFYFDRTPVGKRVSWTKIAGQDGLPDQQPWQFGILDNHHLVLILGTGVGKPITVASVNVWQSSDSQNLRN